MDFCCFSWLEGTTGGVDDEAGDALNCAQIVAWGNLGFWNAEECNDLRGEVSSKCCGDEEPEIPEAAADT
jgi:hypothetical protein